jgi:acyl carrier protein
MAKESSMAVTEELIRNIARVTRCSEQDLTPEMELKTIKADSLHWVQIIVGVENALDIEIDIDKEKMSNLATIADFAKYVEQFC